MERIDRILQHPLFQFHLEANNRAEVDRHFCHHNMGHFLDVARIGQIMALEEDIPVERESIYAAALLHDMGKHIQYEDGTPHEEASVPIAEEILRDSGFSPEEQREIIDAIRSHRNAAIAKERDLRGVLYRGDKASRACYACPVEEQCNWKEGKKNKSLRY